MASLLFAVRSPAGWETWRPATCFPDDCFCEAVRDTLVRQPANTWSSLAFVIVALWVAVLRLRRGLSGAALSDAEAGLFSGSLALIGLASAFYHASLTFAGQVFDVSGMYLVATFILLHRLGPRWRISPPRSVFGFVGANAALMTLQVTAPSMRRPAFGILLVAALVVEWKSSRSGRAWLGAGALLMAVAFGIWVVDRERLVCAPQSPVQGHAIWHLLGALAAACLWRSYETEGARPMA